MKKTVIKVLIACLIVSGVGVGGYFGYQKIFGSKTVATSASYITMTAKKMNLEVKVQGTGSVYAANTKDISVNTNGIVNGLEVNVGDTVEKDAVLGTITSDQVDQSVANAQSNLQKQQLQVSKSTSDQEIKLQQMIVNDAQSDLNSALDQQNKMILKSPVEGTVKAVSVQNGENVNIGKVVITVEGSDSVSREVVAANNGIIKNLNVSIGSYVKKDSVLCTVYSDQIDKQASSARTNLEKQKLQLTNLINNNDPSIKNASVIDAQKQLNSAIAAKDALTLKAPFSGIITAKNNKSGDSVQSGKAILSIVDPTSYKIKVSVDELDIAKIKLGQKAEITFGGLKDQIFQGAVEQISKIGNSSNNVTTFDVVVSIDNAQNVFLGMNANVSILTDSKENALVIPAEALVERDGKKYVMVAGTGTSSNSQGAAPVSAQAPSNGQNSSNEQNNVNGQGNWKTGQQGSNNGQAGGGTYGQGSANRQRSSNGSYSGAGMPTGGRLIEIKTGLENENYIEVLEGVTEGQKLIVQLPQSTTQNNNMKQMMNGGFGGNANFGGNGGNRPQMQSGSQKKD